MVENAIHYAVYTTSNNRDRVNVGHIIPTPLPETDDNANDCYGHILSENCPCNPKLRDESPITFTHNVIDQNHLRDLAITHIDALIKLAGLDKSESATEMFIFLLGEAVIKADEELEKSHDEGLCLDCRGIVVDALLRNGRM